MPAALSLHLCIGRKIAMKQNLKVYLKRNALTFILICFLIAMLIFIPQQIKVSLIAQDTVSPRFFPYVSVIAALVCCALSLVTDVFSMASEIKKGKEVDKKKDENTSYLRVIICIALLLVWYLVIKHVGFIISTVAVTFILSYMLGNRNKISLIVFPVVFTLAIYFVFSNLLHVNLPEILF